MVVNGTLAFLEGCKYLGSSWPLLSAVLDEEFSFPFFCSSFEEPCIIGVDATKLLFLRSVDIEGCPIVDSVVVRKLFDDKSFGGGATRNPGSRIFAVVSCLFSHCITFSFVLLFFLFEKTILTLSD